jgi:hypothetical protein
MPYAPAFSYSSNTPRMAPKANTQREGIKLINTAESFEVALSKMPQDVALIVREKLKALLEKFPQKDFTVELIPNSQNPSTLLDIKPTDETIALLEKSGLGKEALLKKGYKFLGLQSFMYPERGDKITLKHPFPKLNETEQEALERRKPLYDNTTFRYLDETLAQVTKQLQGLQEKLDETYDDGR